MSWYSGSQLTAVSDSEAETPAGPLNASMFAERLRCVTTTPFGVVVDPDVNCTNAMSSDFTVAWESEAGSSSVSTVTTRDSSGQTDCKPSRCAWRLAVVTTARAPHDLKRPAVAARYCGSALVCAGG